MIKDWKAIMNQAMGQLLDDYELDRVPDRVPVTSIGPQVNHDHTHEKNVFLGENHFFGVINQNDSALPFMCYIFVCFITFLAIYQGKFGFGKSKHLKAHLGPRVSDETFLLTDHLGPASVT